MSTKPAAVPHAQELTTLLSHLQRAELDLSRAAEVLAQVDTLGAEEMMLGLVMTRLEDLVVRVKTAQASSSARLSH